MQVLLKLSTNDDVATRTMLFLCKPTPHFKLNIAAISVINGFDNKRGK